MENTMLIGLSRQIALQHQMDVVANNLANTQTAGYKRETLVFQDYVMPVADMPEAEGPDSEITYVIDADTIRDYSEGDFNTTGGSLDVAINGKGWFVIQTPAGERYSRNGQFTLDAGGNMVTSEGHPVQGTGGTITFNPDETDIKIAADGTISTSQGEKGKIRVVAFSDEIVLKKEGTNLYTSEEAPSEASGVRVVQGMYERSNVQPVIEMTKMIEVMRSYIATAKMLDSAAKISSQAIETLGQAPA